jgi:phage portal protein BeeE
MKTALTGEVLEHFKAAHPTLKRTLPASWFNRVFDLPQSGSIREPYRNSVWVMRAIKKISGPVASVPVEVYHADAMEDLRTKLMRRGWPGCERISAHAALQRFKSSPRTAIKFALRAGYITRDEAMAVQYSEPGLLGWLNEPSVRLSWSDFVEAVIGWLKLKGENFWLMQDAAKPFPEATNGWPKVIIARPDRMREIPSGDEVNEWQWTDKAGKVWPIADLDLIQVKYWNPYNDWRGLAEWEAAQIAADADYLAGKFKRDLMANNGDTGPIVGIKNGSNLNDDQIKQVREQLREKRRLQQQGIYVPIFLPAEIQVEDPKVRSVDTTYVAVRLEDRHEVFIAFGVPPSMADVKAAYSIGSASDQYDLIVNTCIPTGVKMCDGLQRLFKKITKADLEVTLDWDEHPVMQAVRRERFASVDTFWTKGMPMKVVGEYLDLELPDFDGSDIGYLPFNVAPVGQPEPAPEKNPTLTETETDDSVDEALKALRAAKLTVRQPAVKPHCDCCGCSLEEKDLQVRGRDAREIAQWKSIVAPRLPTIKKFRAKFDKVLFEARRQCLAKLERGQKSVAADFLFNLHDFIMPFQAALRAVSLEAVQEAGDQVYAELKRDDPWKSPSQATLKFLAERENKLSGVPPEIHERIKRVIAEGLESGDPLDEIAAAVKGEFNDISDGRGRVIAQTETAAAFGFGRHAAMQSAGIQFKRWLTSGNSNVRLAHRMMNGTIIPIEEEFVVVDPKTGESDEILHPGDADGAPWNVINCHCVEIASAEGPDNKD